MPQYAIMRFQKQKGGAGALEAHYELNASKKRDEALALLQKFFPSMEKFETQVRKYKREIGRLEQSNAALAKKAAAGEKESFSKQLETAILTIYNDSWIRCRKK